MRNGKSIVLIAVYLIAMAVIYALLEYEQIGTYQFIGGIVIGSALFMVVNRTWFLQAPEA